MSFAGATGGSGGLSSMGFNPAALGLVDDLELSGGLSLILPIADGTVVSGPAAGQSVEAGRLGGVASGYVGYRADEQLLFGFGLYTPFGLSTQYDAGWVGQGDALTSKLVTIAVVPTIAWQPIPELTLAASAKATYFDARLTNAVAILDGTSWEISFNAGALWQPTPMTQIGIGYQHGYDLEVTGFVVPAGGPTLPATATASLPSTVSVSITQSITDDLRFMAEAQWMNWSKFEAITSNFAGRSVRDPQNYDDAFFVALGGEYDVSNALTLRLGAAWDQTPTNDDILPGTSPALGITNRTARVPDADRLWLSLGVSFEVTDHMTLDAAYSYLHALDDANVGLRSAPGTTVIYDGGAHIFSIGGSMTF